MKKVVLVFMAIVLVSLAIGMAFGENAKINTEAIVDGACYDKEFYEAEDLVKEWILSVGDKRNAEKKLIDGYWYGYGIIDGYGFNDDYGCNPTIENIKEILGTKYDLSKFEIVVAGYIDDYAVYKMVAESETETIGYEWNYETEEYDEYCKGSIYYMVVYNN